MPPSLQVEKLTFGLFEVDLRTEEIWRSGRKTRCQHQPFQVLRRLLEQPNEVVSREELRQAIWGSHSPADADHSLGIAINKLREALGDSAEASRFVETLARRGYRFIAPVQPVVTPDEEIVDSYAEALPPLTETATYPRPEFSESDVDPVPPRTGTSRTAILYTVLLLLAGLLGGFLVGHLTARSDPAHGAWSR